MQWQIQDFPEGLRQPGKEGGANLSFIKNFAENCMKIKENGPDVARRWRPLYPPMV